MTYMYGSDLASGGWDALDNVVSGIGQGANPQVSSFFPTPQRETMVSETVQAAGATGQTYRPTIQENQSMLETNFWRDLGWFGSPYQENLSVTAKRQEGSQLAATVEPGKDVIGESLDWALTQTRKITTLFDQFSGNYEPREVITEKPRAGTPEGRDVRNLNQVVERGADVIKAGTAAVGQIFNQVKGLFNLGFPQTGKQPGFSLRHELDPSPKLTIGFIAIAAIIILILMRKK